MMGESGVVPPMFVSFLSRSRTVFASSRGDVDGLDFSWNCLILRSNIARIVSDVVVGSFTLSVVGLLAPSKFGVGDEG